MGAPRPFPHDQVQRGSWDLGLTVDTWEPCVKPPCMYAPLQLPTGCCDGRVHGSCSTSTLTISKGYNQQEGKMFLPCSPFCPRSTHNASSAESPDACTHAFPLLLCALSSTQIFCWEFCRLAFPFLHVSSSIHFQFIHMRLYKILLASSFSHQVYRCYYVKSTVKKSQFWRSNVAWRIYWQQSSPQTFS